MSVQPGWYADPAEPTTQRYWDGEGWIGAPLPADATPPPGPPPVEPEEPEVPAAPTTGAAPADSGVPATPTAGAGHPAPTSGAGTAYPPAGPPGSAPPWVNGTPPPGTPPFPPGQLPPGTPPFPPGQLPPGTPPFPPGQLPPGATPPGWPYPPYGYQLPPQPRPHGLALAQFGTRLVARLIDIVLVFLLAAAVNAYLVLRYVEEISPFYREVFRRSLAGDTSTSGLPQVSSQADGLQVAILLLTIACWFAYEVPAMANSGQTVGKRLMGIKVVPLAEEAPLGLGRAFRRWNTLGGLPSLLWYCCGIGFLLQLFDCVSALFDRPLRQALHDKRAQTVVVQVPRAPGDRGTGERATDDRTDPPGGSA
ncbi:RDD family protein [Micromonospora sp. NPDC049559]|uniref:RDD family protein n=1 Tax=Micromonospora sp. NPDC049559 TaxID=3155923 RepID=UPI00341D774B